MQLILCPMIAMRRMLLLVAALVASSRAEGIWLTKAVTEPAPIACNAAYSTSCARTNSEYLARRVAQELAETPNKDTFLQAINEGRHNLDKGFYPFVFDRNTSECVAHGAYPKFAGKSIHEIFNITGIAFSDATALHERFLAANNTWVLYLWSDGAAADTTQSGLAYTDQGELNYTVHSKLAFVVNVEDLYYLGVGYEGRPLPQDLPCSDSFDSWCSLTNVLSLVGKAQFRLSQAHSVEEFEANLFDISFSSDFKLPGGFYLFMYDKEGLLKAHGVLRDHFGNHLADIYESEQIGSRDEGESLHNQFLSAVENDSTGAGSFVQYKWRNKNKESFIKIGFLVRVVFGSELFYVGAGFNYDLGSVPVGPLGTRCSASYNLPCSFAISLQLSSHALSHAISSPWSTPEMFNAITNDATFKAGDENNPFYLFVYEVESAICVAHGSNSTFAEKKMNLTQIIQSLDLALNATNLHKQFTNAASQGGGWVLYDWQTPGSRQGFKKISYIFQINLDGKTYYGGIGFNHARGPVQEFDDKRQKKNHDPIDCTSDYGLNCSEVNAQAIVGQAAAELRLSSTDAIVGTSADAKKNISSVLSSITEGKDPLFAVKDFDVKVFSVEADEKCRSDDRSGCCVADGSNRHVNKTWQEILDTEGITSTGGSTLHNELVIASRNGRGLIGKPVSDVAYWSTWFRDKDRDYYVVSSYNTTIPNTCDECPSKMKCTKEDQSICEPEGERPITQNPSFITILVLFAVGTPLAACLFYRQKRSAYVKRRLLEDEMDKLAARMEQQMQGMFEVTHDLPIHGADEYRNRIGVDATTASSRNTLAVWYWEEDEAHIDKHKDEMVLSGTRFVSYSKEISGQIEHAYKLFVEGRGFKEFRIDLTDKITSTASRGKVHNNSTGYHYEINFETLRQRNTSSKHERDVRREECQLIISSEVMDDLPPLPNDLDLGYGEEQEDLLPTFRGQLIQVSKVHLGNQWLYGNVLYDPLMDEALKQSDNHGDGALNVILAQALHDRPTSGWFPRSVTKPADVKVMHKLIKSLGGAGMDNLAPPEYWNESGTEQVKVQKNTAEYTEVSNFFSNALYTQRDKVRITEITRLQNLPLWQSYAVKKETMKSRDASNLAAYRVNNLDLSVEALERRWLFHGTHPDVIHKIVKQGFNRSFAGRNAVAYGRGVYFARDACYSIHPTYSAPDDSGVQYIFMCRVAVGDWSKGSTGIITPDPKPHNHLELFDSTVDNVLNPSIFVIYHDAQAYPEYLVAFRIGGSRRL